MASSDQGGSILSFLIIGGVLVALLLGGAYYVQQRSNATDSDKAPVATQPAAQSNGATDEKPTPATKDEKTAVEPKNEEAKTSPTPEATSQPTTQLPKTGPAESLSGVLVAGLLTFFGLSYLQSRKVQA
ncbi:MAG: LPXTG cell wall anchor domain-containing protein [Candidatus Saccharimonadales bacterium]